MTDEIALIIEQNRQTHQKVSELHALLQSHIKEDKIMWAEVNKHVTYWGITKWILVTSIGVLLSWLGVRHLG